MLPAFERDLFTGYSQRNPLYLSTNVAVVHCAKANLSDRVVISNSNYEVNTYKLKDVEFILDMHVGKFNTWVQMSTFSSSDKYLAVLVANEITIYDASLYCKMMLTFCPHNFGCMFIHWSRSISSETDLYLATCGKDGTVKLWTSNTLWNTDLSRDMTHPSTADLMLGLVQDPSDLIRDRAHRDMGHKGTVACAAFNSCDSHILSAGVDNKIILWLVENGSKLMVFESHLDVVLSVCWTKDDTRFASVGGDCRVLVWRITQKSPIQWFEGHSDTIESCHFLNGDYLLTVGRDREFFVWDVSSMVELPDSLDVRQKRNSKYRIKRKTGSKGWVNFACMDMSAEMLLFVTSQLQNSFVLLKADYDDPVILSKPWYTRWIHRILAATVIKNPYVHTITQTVGLSKNSMEDLNIAAHISWSWSQDLLEIDKKNNRKNPTGTKSSKLSMRGFSRGLSRAESIMDPTALPSIAEDPEKKRREKMHEDAKAQHLSARQQMGNHPGAGVKNWLGKIYLSRGYTVSDKDDTHGKNVNDQKPNEQHDPNDQESNIPEQAQKYREVEGEDDPFSDNYKIKPFSRKTNRVVPLK